MSFQPVYCDEIRLGISGFHTIDSQIELIFSGDTEASRFFRAFLKLIFTDFKGGPISIAPWADFQTIGSSQVVDKDGAYILDYKNLDEKAKLFGILVSPQLASTTSFNLLATLDDEETPSSTPTPTPVPTSEESTQWIIVDGPGKGITISSEPGFPEVIDKDFNSILNASGQISQADSDCPGPKPHFTGSIRDDILVDMCGWGHVIALEETSGFLGFTSQAITSEIEQLALLNNEVQVDVDDELFTESLIDKFRLSFDMLRLQLKFLKLLRGKLEPKSDLINIFRDTKLAVKVDRDIIRILNRHKKLKKEGLFSSGSLKKLIELGINAKTRAFEKMVEHEEKLKMLEEELSEEIDELINEFVNENDDSICEIVPCK